MEHVPQPNNRKVTFDCQLVLDVVGDALHFFSPLIVTVTL